MARHHEEDGFEFSAQGHQDLDVGEGWSRAHPPRPPSGDAMKYGPLLFIPGTVPWVLLGIGAAKHNDTLIGTGVVLMVLVIVVGLALKARAGMAARVEAGRIWGAGKQGKAKIVDISTKGGSINDN